MAFEDLILGPGARLSSAWFTRLVQYLQLIYGMTGVKITPEDLLSLASSIVPEAPHEYTLGSPGFEWLAIYGDTGFFNSSLYVAGRPVLKDGDPITVSDIGPNVQAFFSALEADLASRTDRIYGKLAPIKVDTYGNVGIAIYDDRLGLARDSTLSTLYGLESQHLPKLQNLDTALSSRASESTLSSIYGLESQHLPSLSKLDVNLSAFYGYATQYLPNLSKLDANLSTRASESTLSALYGVESQHLPSLSKLDVNLSTRASESTLSLIYGKIAPLRFDENGNLMVAVYGGAGGGAGGEVTIVGDTIGLARDATLQMLDSNLKSRQPRYIVDSSGNELSSYIKNLDTALSVLARLFRWGRDVTPTWVHGSEVTAPATNTALVSKTVSSGKSGYIYGFFITAGEANDFLISWTSGGATYSRRIVFGGKGSLQYVDIIPLNEGLPADSGTAVSITNVNAGGAGVIYQAAVLYAEV